MPLISFSEPDHIAKLLDGRKQQTTRLPRKNRIKVGDTLYCYYKSRAKKSCNNCIVQKCAGRSQVVGNICSHHTNFFGKSKVLAVVQIQNIVNKYTDEMALTEWAQNDGFVNWQAADKWFTEKYGEDWKEMPFESIFFLPEWVEP